MTDCQNCEYHRQRAQRWRDEAYKQSGHPLPEREWVALTNDDYAEIKQRFDIHDWPYAVAAKLKEKNYG